MMILDADQMRCANSPPPPLLSAAQANTKGSRRSEGHFINKSLLTLGHVIWKLSEASRKNIKVEDIAQHIPYRDSKLTRLLQPSLGGNAQIAIICNVSPEAKHAEETHNTLKFASRAKVSASGFSARLDSKILTHTRSAPPLPPPSPTENQTAGEGHAGSRRRYDAAAVQGGDRYSSDAA